VLTACRPIVLVSANRILSWSCVPRVSLLGDGMHGKAEGYLDEDMHCEGVLTLGWCNKQSRLLIEAGTEEQ
jgi:hypothetical protein